MIQKFNMCKHYQQLINQGIWWCDNQYNKSSPNIGYYLNCDCERCPEKDLPENQIGIWIESVTSEKYNE